MEDSSSGPSTSPSKRQAEDRETVGGSEPSKKLKANHTFVHDEFTRYKYTVSGGEVREGSKCNHCQKESKDINPTNLRLHLRRLHPKVCDAVEGEICLMEYFSSLPNVFFFIQLVIKLIETLSRKSMRKFQWSRVCFPNPRSLRVKEKQRSV